MIKSKCTAILAILAMMGALGGCDDDPAGDDPAASPSSASSSSDGGGETGSPTSSLSTSTSPSDDPDEESCSGLTAQEAVDKWLSKVPPNKRSRANKNDQDPFAWSSDVASENGYDECADLSWINIGIVAPTASSPEHVMLFHRGDFVMTATVEPEQIVPTVERKSDGEIEIAFRFQRPGEVFAEASGRAASTYKWDERRSTIVRSGDLPDGNESDAKTVGDDRSHDAISCAGGFQPPEGVDDSVCGEPSGDAKELAPGRNKAALIFTPTQNIWCSFNEDVLDCSMINPTTRIDLGRSGKAYTPNRGDGPVSENGTTVKYGQTVTYGPFACVSQEVGLSCWNKQTRHGLFLSKEKTHMW